MSVRSRARSLYRAHDYGFVFGLVVTMFVLLAAAPDTPTVRVLAALLGAAIVVAVYVTGGVKPRLRIVGISAAGAGILVVLLSHLGSANTVKVATALTSALLVLIAGAGIWRGIGLQPVVDRRTISGVVTTYLLIGLFFAYVYSAVGAATHEAFFASGRSETIAHFVYFSYVTMTTVGFGDFTAATDLGRTITVVEALLGQLYLVTVVALVVGNVGRARKRSEPKTDS